MSNIFKPHRGKRSTMLTTKKDIVLQSGELFLEYSDNGLGKGSSLFKVGNGSSAYKDLPYTNNEVKVEFTDKNACWYRLGVLTIPNGGYFFELNARIGTGYNAGGINQDASFIIRFRTSNSSSKHTENNVDVYAEGWVEYLTEKTYDILVKVNSKTEYEFWTSKVNFTGVSFYTAIYSQGISFDTTSLTSTEEPEYTYILPKYVVQYDKYAIDCGDEGLILYP